MANPMLLIGGKAVEFIQQNLDASIDVDSKQFETLSFQYWFYRYKRRKYRGKYLRGKKSAKWQAFKSAAYSEWGSAGKKVTLTSTGAMRASLSPISSDGNSVTIGFLDAESARIAFYHNVSGAGKGRIIRKFMGLHKEQEDELAGYAADLISKDKIFIAGLLKSLGLELE